MGPRYPEGMNIPRMIIAIPLLALAVVACDWFKDDEVSIPKPPADRGEFKPGPVDYTGDDGQTHHCNPPGGWCSSDNRCHSSAAKCPVVRD
jgi:hypothetical protein